MHSVVLAGAQCRYCVETYEPVELLFGGESYIVL